MGEPARVVSNGRGRPFVKGNGGRKPGSRNRATQIAAALAEGDVEALVNKAKELALSGDVSMLKFLLGRVLPRDRLITIDLPHTLHSDDDPVEALAKVACAVAEGKISPSEGAALASLMDCYRRALELSELTRRISELEAEFKIK